MPIILTMTNLSLTESSTLAECECVIECGLAAIFETGKALTKIRDLRLYRERYSTFEQYCAERWNISRPRAYQLIEASSVVENLSTIVDKPALPTRESHARPLVALQPEQQRVAWGMALEESNGQPTANDIQRAVEVVKTPISAASDYDGDEWYTPNTIISDAHQLLGGIDLDPASCETAQRTVQAKRYFTKSDDGLAKQWRGNVWLNRAHSQILGQKSGMLS